MKYVLTNKKELNHPEVSYSRKLSCGYYLHYKKDTTFYSERNIQIFIDGYVIPRNSNFDLYKKYPQHELVLKLYEKHGVNFPDYLKGIFFIIISDNDTVHIFSDHLGIYQFFYSITDKEIEISNSVDLLGSNSPFFEEDVVSLKIRSLFNRVIGNKTIYKNIFSSSAALHIEINARSGIKTSSYWSYESLMESTPDNSDYTIPFFADLIRENTKNIHEYLKPESYTITLTGGKDSRTGLAALLNQEVKPIGFTYGNPLSRDAVYASLVAQKAGIKHFIFNPDANKNWHHAISSEITKTGNPEISLHRAHRYFAFIKIAKMLEDNSAYFAGYLAGELLMGAYYDNLIFTDFLWDLMHGKKNDGSTRLTGFFHKDIKLCDETRSRLSQLKCLDSSLSQKEREFHSFFENGIPHHAQDIFLAMQKMKFAVPFFLDLDFLECLFKSNYSFFYRNNQSSNPLVRYDLFEFNLKVQHLLFPDLDTVPFGKRGSYSTKEFLKGRLYWSFLKTFRYLKDKKKYPATYQYDRSYKEFILSILQDIENNPHNRLHVYFDISKAIDVLSSSGQILSEKDLRPFTNIVHLELFSKNMSYEV